MEETPDNAGSYATEKERIEFIQLVSCFATGSANLDVIKKLSEIGTKLINETIDNRVRLALEKFQVPKNGSSCKCQCSESGELFEEEMKAVKSAFEKLIKGVSPDDECAKAMSDIFELHFDNVFEPWHGIPHPFDKCNDPQESIRSTTVKMTLGELADLQKERDQLKARVKELDEGCLCCSDIWRNRALDLEREKAKCGTTGSLGKASRYNVENELARCPGCGGLWAGHGGLCKDCNLLEKLAALEHEQWAHWTRHFLNNISMENFNRWSLQMNTPYNKLTDKEKESDREYARKVLEAIKE